MSLHCIRKDAQVYFSRSAAPWCAQTRRAQCPSTGPPPHRRPSRGPPMPTCFLLFLNNGHQSHNLVPIGGLVAFDHRSGSFCFLRPEFLRVNEDHRSATPSRQRFYHPPPSLGEARQRAVTSKQNCLHWKWKSAKSRPDLKRTSAGSLCCPLYPQQRTFIRTMDTSGLCR